MLCRWITNFHVNLQKKSLFSIRNNVHLQLLVNLSVTVLTEICENDTGKEKLTRIRFCN